MQSLQSLLVFALFTDNCYYIKVHYKEKNISKLIYTSSEKQNVRSDQSSLSFRVGHCHRQLIGMNMYIANIYRNKVERYVIHMLHHNKIPKSLRTVC